MIIGVPCAWSRSFNKTAIKLNSSYQFSREKERKGVSADFIGIKSIFFSYLNFSTCVLSVIHRSCINAHLDTQGAKKVGKRCVQSGFSLLEIGFL